MTSVGALERQRKFYQKYKDKVAAINVSRTRR
jgi:hypothetical protein